jgi:hypothetical protein
LSPCCFVVPSCLAGHSSGWCLTWLVSRLLVGGCVLVLVCLVGGMWWCFVCSPWFAAVCLCLCCFVWLLCVCVCLSACLFALVVAGACLLVLPCVCVC